MNHRQDCKYLVLGDQGYQGSIQDRWMAWLEDNGVPNGQLQDMEDAVAGVPRLQRCVGRQVVRIPRRSGVSRCASGHDVGLLV